MLERKIASLGNYELVWRKRKVESIVNKRATRAFKQERSTFSLPVIPDRLQGDLVNVASFISFSLRQENPNLFAEVDTSNPYLISERTPEDSLRILLSVRGVDPENLSLRIVKDFSSADLSRTEKLNLAEKVQSLLEEISPKD